MFSLHADQEIILIEDDDEVQQPLQLGKLQIDMETW
jgi:hypothetical protein